jgi:tetratricopeptide (TPR) repeat protein
LGLDENWFLCFSKLVHNEILKNFLNSNSIKEEEEFQFSRLFDVFFERIIGKKPEFSQESIFSSQEENSLKKKKVEVTFAIKMKYLKEKTSVFLENETNEEKKKKIQKILNFFVKISNIFGLDFIKKGDYESCTSLLNYCINLKSIDKHSIGMSNLLLSISLKISKNMKFYGYLEVVSEFCPDSPLVLYICGSFLYELNQFEESKKLFEKIIKLNEKFTFESLNMIGCIYVQQVESFLLKIRNNFIMHLINLTKHCILVIT